MKRGRDDFVKTAVRYYSRLGHTEKIAQAIAEGAGVVARSIVEEPVLPEKAEVLFLGGAPYANIMAPELKSYAEGLTAELVGRVILFTTSNWSRRTVRALKKLIREKRIPVEDEYFYAHMRNIRGRTEAAKEFGRKMA